MPKYDPLTKHLQTLGRHEDHKLRFEEIERILGFRLPASARTHRAWWANQGNGRHVQAKAWHAAGWHTKEADLKSREVTFTPMPRRPKTAGELLRALSIAEAKKAVALKFGVRPEDVEIIVRG